MVFQGSDPRKRLRRTSPFRFLHRAKAPAGDFSAPAFVYQILSQTPCSFNWVPFFCNWKSSPVLAFLCSIYWKTNKNKNRALRSCIFFFNFRRPCGREGKLQLCYHTEQSKPLMYLVSFVYTSPFCSRKPAWAWSTRWHSHRVPRCVLPGTGAGFCWCFQLAEKNGKLNAPARVCCLH